MNYLEKISKLDIWYVPIIVVALMLLLGFWTGFWRGWKTALYYLAWNAAGFIAGILILDALYENEVKHIADNLLSKFKDNLGEKAVDDTLSLLKGWVILLVVLGAMSVLNVVATIIFWIWLKKRWVGELKRNKQEGKSNTKSRMIGGVIGVIAAIPSTVGAVGAATIVSKNPNVNSWTDKVTKIVTFGKVDAITEDYDAMYGLVLSAPSAGDLGYLFIGAMPQIAASTDKETQDYYATAVKGLRDNSESIVRMLNNSRSAQIAKDVLDYVVNEKNKDQYGIKLTQKGITDTEALKYTGDDKKEYYTFSRIFHGLTQTGKDNLISLLDKFKESNLDVRDFVEFLTDK